MRYCPVSRLSVNSRLARHVLSPQGDLLLKSNTELTPFLIERLKTMNYAGVYIYDELSKDIEVVDNISTDLVIKAVKANAKADIDDCIYVANSICDVVMSTDSIQTNLTSLCSFDNYTYQHSVNVAVYSAILGLRLNLTQVQLRNLVSAAMLHDIGKQAIPVEILNKTDKLTDEEMAIMRQHPQLGYDLLKDNAEVASTVRVAVLEHHENWDGSGYPHGRAGEDIYELARIIHICDVYDALISKRVYKDKKPPSAVLEYLMGSCGTMFDTNMMVEFMKCIVPFPNGTLVKLSDGEDAIVVKNTPSLPLRPTIRLLNGSTIDLTEVTNIVIDDYSL